MSDRQVLLGCLVRGVTIVGGIAIGVGLAVGLVGYAIGSEYVTSAGFGLAVAAFAVGLGVLLVLYFLDAGWAVVSGYLSRWRGNGDGGGGDGIDIGDGSYGGDGSDGGDGIDIGDFDL
jgi:hypothetical protein